MKKSIFYIFLLFVVTSVWIVLSYLESNHFTLVFNKYLKERIEDQIGIEFEFDRVSITPFPPSISLVNFRVLKIKENNLLKLSTNYVMKARELGISFRMLQLFGNKLVINRIYMNKAYIKLQFKKEGRSKGAKIKAEDLDFLKNPIKLYLKSKLFTIQIKQIEINDSSIHLSIKSGNRVNILAIEKVNNLILSKDNQEYYSILADLKNIKTVIDEVERKFNFFKANMDISQDYIGLILMEIQKGELVLSAKGNLFGDITKPKRMQGKLSVISRSNFSELSNIIPFFKNLKLLKGKSFSKLELEGSFYSHTLKGSLSVENFNYSLWNFDKVETTINYLPGKLSVQEIKIKDRDGEISVSPIVIDMNESEIKQKVKLTLKDVNFNKFAGDMRKSINVIKMILNGELDLETKLLIKDKKIQLEELIFLPKLLVKNFVIDNQEYNKIKPTQKIVQLIDFFLDAKVRWKNQFLYFEEGTLESDAGNLMLSGTVNDKNQFNINLLSDDLNLGTFFSKVLNIPIEGTGPLVFNILGPSSNLIFNFILNSKNTKYLGLNLGHLKGELTYDTKVSTLFIKNAKASRATGNYEVKGEFSEKRGLDLDVKLLKMPLQEIFTVFAEQLRAIDWIPYDARANVSGSGKITGGFNNIEKDINVKLNTSATDISYKRERFSKLHAEVGLTKGIYYFKGLDLKKYNSSILGDLSYDTINKKLIYGIKALNMRLQELDFFSRLRTAIDAPFTMELQGEGPIKNFNSVTNVTIEESDLGEVKVPGVYFEMKTDHEINSIYTKIGKDDTEVFLDISKKGLKKSTMRMRTSGKEFSFLLCLINKNICRDKAELSLDASLIAEWNGKKWRGMDGAIELNSIALNIPEIQIATTNSVNMKIDNGYLNSKPLKLTGESSEFFADFSNTSFRNSFFLKLNGKINLGISKIFLPIIDRVYGGIDVLTSISINSKDKIKFDGGLSIKEASFFVNGLDTPIKAFRGKIALESNEINIESLQGELGGGNLDVSGGSKIFLDAFPELDVKISLSNNKVKFFPLDYALIKKGILKFKGSDLPYSFEGDLDLKESLIIKNFSERNIYSGGASSYLPLIALEDKPLYRLNINVNSKRKSYIRNDIIDGEFKSKILVLNNFQNPRLFGSGRLIKGKLFFRQTPFEIKYLNFKFSGKSNSDPVISLGASSKVKKYTVNLTVHGDTLNPKINFNSNPSLSQKSILYLLAIGVENDRENLTEQRNIESLAYSEAGSFLLDQFNLNNSRDKNFSFDVTTSSRKSEVDIIRSRSEISITVPKIKIYTNILRNIDASVGTTIGAGVDSEVDLNLEYRLSDNFSVNSIYEQEPSVNAGEARSSYGADFKIQWVFE